MCMNPKPTLSCLPQPPQSKQQGGRGLHKNTEGTGITGSTHTNKHSCAVDRQQIQTHPRKHCCPTRPTLCEPLSESLGDPSSPFQLKQSTSVHTESQSSASTLKTHTHTLPAAVPDWGTINHTN